MKTIKQYRKALRMDVPAILQLSGWSRGTYKRISSGARKLSNLECIGLDSLVAKRRAEKHGQ